MNIIKVLSFLLVLITIVSCKTTKDVCDIEYYEETVFIDDTLFFPGDHIHLDEEHLCGWSHDTTVVICLELPIKIPKPINK